MDSIVLKFTIQCYISSLYTNIFLKIRNLKDKKDFFKHKMIVKFSAKVAFQLEEEWLEIKSFLGTEKCLCDKR